MNVGMLWYDNDPKAEFTVKLERAAAYYRTKYGKTPNLCFVHPTMMPVLEAAPEPGADQNQGTAPHKNGGIEVRTTRSVLPNHFWIGLNQ